MIKHLSVSNLIEERILLISPVFLAGNDSSYTSPSYLQQQMEQQQLQQQVPVSGGVPQSAAVPAPQGPPRPPPPVAQPQIAPGASGRKFWGIIY